MINLDEISYQPMDISAVADSVIYIQFDNSFILPGFVSLYWAELDSDKKKEALIYNLGADSEQTLVGNRSFGISINGVTVVDDFNVARDYGYARAVIKKFVVTVKNGKGLSIDFHKKEGETILNAIRIYRNY